MYRIYDERLNLLTEKKFDTRKQAEDYLLNHPIYSFVTLDEGKTFVCNETIPYSNDLLKPGTYKVSSLNVG